MENPEPQPPLYMCPPRCYTCANVISQIWHSYNQKIKELTGNDITTLPIRTINSQKLMSDNSKTAEGKILDNLGVTRYCCRRMILTASQNNTSIINN